MLANHKDKLRARKVRAYGKNTPHKKLAARHRCRSLVSGTPSQEKEQSPGKAEFFNQTEGNDRQCGFSPVFCKKIDNMFLNFSFFCWKFFTTNGFFILLP